LRKSRPKQPASFSHTMLGRWDDKSMPEPLGGAPDFMEPLCAYRAWKFEGDKLLSLNGVEWTPGEAHVATCNRGLVTSSGMCGPRFGHTAPDPTCTCGIYAGKNLEHLVEINYAQMGIHGEVDLWGNVLECELGYRAQYAYPRYFVVPPWLLFDLHEAEFKLAILSQFNVDIYVAGEQRVSRDMKKIMLKPKGESIFDPEGVNQLTANVQQVYEAMKRRASREPEVGERLHIRGKGISVITAVNADTAVAMLFNTTVCTVPRSDVRWNIDNFRFECDPSSFCIRSAR
jgi:hypothetical protein